MQKILNSFLISLALIISHTTLTCQEWSKTFSIDSNSSSSFSHVLLTNEGNFLMTGLLSNGKDSTYPYIVLLNKNGDLVWQQKYAELNGRILGQAIQGEKGFIIVGENRTYLTAQILFLFIDEKGKSKYFKEYGKLSELTTFKSIVKSNDGDLVMRASVSSLFDSFPFYFHDKLYKINIQGDTVWTKSYTNLASNSTDIIQTDDNGYLMCSDSISTNPIRGGERIDFKVDTFGVPIYAKPTLSSSAHTSRFKNGKIFKQTKGTNFFVVDQKSELLWNSCPDSARSPFRFFNSVQLSGLALVAGDDKILSISSFISGNETFFFLSKFNEQGKTLWTKKYPILNEQARESINWFANTLTDTCVIAVGNKDVSRFPIKYVSWVAKFGNCPLLTSNKELENNTIRIKIFKNPMDYEAIVKLINAPINTNGVFEIIDLQGKLLQTHSFTGDSFTVNRNNISRGMYFIRIKTNDGKTGTEKLVIE